MVAKNNPICNNSIYLDQMEGNKDEFLLVADHSLEDDEAKEQMQSIIYEAVGEFEIQETCGNTMLLKNINSQAVTNGVRIGPNRGTVIVSNFAFSLPLDVHHVDDFFDLPANNPDEMKKGDRKVVVIAVLDTGIDMGDGPGQIPEEFFWKGTVKINGENKIVSGRNFVNYCPEKCDPEDIADDSVSKHGTLVTSFILNQFKGSNVEVKIMNLKTHDSYGEGNFFSIYNALKFAIQHDALIINASWGFYESLQSKVEVIDSSGETIKLEDKFEPFKKLLLEDLLNKNTLFITAAGNASALADKIYTQSQMEVPSSNGKSLRDVSKHRFYPAFFGSEGNAPHILVTTSVLDWEGELKVCPKQNYSNEVVNAAILGHVPVFIRVGEKEYLKEILYRLPLKTNGSQDEKLNFVSGSSYASAILTGIIGSQYSDTLFVKDSGNSIEVLSRLMSGEVDIKLEEYVKGGKYFSSIK